MNSAQRPKPHVGPGSGEDVIADQPDVLPSERSDVRLGSSRITMP